MQDLPPFYVISRVTSLPRKPGPEVISIHFRQSGGKEMTRDVISFGTFWNLYETRQLPI